MIGIARVVNRIITVLCGEFEEKVFLPLPGYQSRHVDTIRGDAGADLESVVVGACSIVLEDITAEVDSRGVEALFIINDLAFEVPFVSWLIAGDGDELAEICAERVCERLVVVGIIGYGVVVLIGKGADDIRFELEIEVLDFEGIDPFDAQLQSLFVCPVPATIMKYLVQDEFIYEELAIELCLMADVGLPVEADGGLVRAAVLLLRRHEEDHGIEVGEIIVIGAAEHDVLEKAYGQPGGRVDVKVMDDPIFFRILIIGAYEMLTDQFHIDGLIVQFPDTGIEFEEEIGGAEIAQEEAAIAIADKILIIAELPIEIFPGVEIDRGAVIEIVEPGGMKRFVIAGAGHGVELIGILLEPAGSAFLVVGQVSGKAQFICDHAPEGKAFGVEKWALAFPGFVGLGLLNGGIDGQEEVFVLDLVKVCFGLIKGVEPGSFAHKAVSVGGDPFDIIGQQGGQVGLVYFGKVVDVVVRIKMMQGIGELGDANGGAPADRFGGSNIEVGIGLLKNLHTFQEMIEFGALRKEGGLGAA